MQISSGVPSSTSSGQDRHTLPVPWGVLLQYEFEMRKWAVKEAHKRGEPLGDLLHEATRNTELKELHFTSQVALAKRSPHDDPPPPPNKWPRKGEKGNKGRGKGNGKNGTKTDGQNKVGENWYDLVSKTPDGRELCFAYNIKRGCQDFCDLAQVVLEISEVDICRDPSMDLLDETTAKRVCFATLDVRADFLLEHPEDLGRPDP
ncbi:unnamed protein product, partial [Symbiodinium pilosum]